MSGFAAQCGLLLAQADSVSQSTVPRWQWDWPESPVGQLSLIGGAALLLGIVLLLYVLDTRRMHPLLRIWLAFLRLGAVALLVVVFLNPQEKTELETHRPSRVVVLADTSISMKFAAEDMADGGISADGVQDRATAIKEMLLKTLPKLSENHEVSVFTFDSKLEARHGLFAPPKKNKRTGEVAEPDDTSKVAQSPADVEWDLVLKPRGGETRMGDSMIELMQQVGGDTLSAFVVAGDGQSNAGINAAAANTAARKSGVRLISVGVGGTAKPVNLTIARVDSPRDVHVGDDYEIHASVQGQGLQGKTAIVELLSRTEGSQDEPQLVENGRQEAVIPEDGIPSDAVTFVRVPDVVGEVEYFIRTKLADDSIGESRPDDNERNFTVATVDRRTGVLVIAGGPLRDYRFVRNLLQRHQAFDVDIWLQTVTDPTTIDQDCDYVWSEFPLEFPKRPPVEQLRNFDLMTDSVKQRKAKEYDIVICFDPNWRAFDPLWTGKTLDDLDLSRMDRLTKWVEKHSGGLILIAGDVFTPDIAGGNAKFTDLLDLYPVVLDQFVLPIQLDRDAQNKPMDITFTPQGKNTAFLSLTDNPRESQEAWEEMGGFYRCYPTSGEKAGASVYAIFNDPLSDMPILMASQYYGSGRVFYLGSAEMWRLRAVSDEFYRRLWTKTIREVGQGRRKRGNSRGTWLLEEKPFILGQRVPLRAQLFDGQLQELSEPEVTIEVLDPEGNPLPANRSLKLDEHRAGQYVSDFIATQEGKYKVVLPIPDSTDVLIGTITVQLPDLESDNPQQDEKVLKDLVRDTGGEYFSATAFAEMVEDDIERKKFFPDKSVSKIVPESLKTLWDREWLMYLLVGLLSAEWLTRKIIRLA